MTLAEQIVADLSEAMKRKEASVVDTLRMLRAAVKNAEIDKGKQLDDGEIQGVIRTSIKQLRDALEQFRTGGRADLVGKTEAELAVLGRYLPAELSDEELGALVERAVSEVGATGEKDFGRVMAAAVKETKGKADGSRVSAMVREKLGK